MLNKYRLEDINISINKEPDIRTRPILPDDTKAEIKNKNKKQFENHKTIILTIFLPNQQFTITAKKGYCYDGATIPWGIGKGDMSLLVPALFHDIMCDKKYLVGRDRNLSSLIFYKLLLECKKDPDEARKMYKVVDFYQRFMKGWEK